MAARLTYHRLTSQRNSQRNAYDIRYRGTVCGQVHEREPGQWYALYTRLTERNGVLGYGTYEAGPLKLKRMRRFLTEVLVREHKHLIHRHLPRHAAGGNVL